MVREALRLLLETETDFHVVGDTGDGLQVMGLVRLLEPDVLVLDVRMPGLNGLEVARQVHQRFPKVRIVMLSAYANEDYVREALLAGAMAYVVKESSSEELMHAIRAAAANQYYLNPPLSKEIIDRYAPRSLEEHLESYDKLSVREREVFHLAAKGYSARKIGDCLYISPRTVEAHMAHLMRKLNVHSRADLIRYALQRGILTIED